MTPQNKKPIPGALEPDFIEKDPYCPSHPQLEEDIWQIKDALGVKRREDQHRNGRIKRIGDKAEKEDNTIKGILLSQTEAIGEIKGTQKALLILIPITLTVILAIQAIIAYGLYNHLLTP
jgi:hypothetical protein